MIFPVFYDIDPSHVRYQTGSYGEAIVKHEEWFQNSREKYNHSPLHIADYPVGLESRLLELNSLVQVGFDGRVCIIGIFGTGWLGKTTLARALYNLISDQFDGLCFLLHVRKNSAKYGLEYLQEKLLFKTVGLTIKLRDINEGIPLIKQRLQGKKVLLILDDVDELNQL